MQQLVILVLNEASPFEDVLAAWHDAGAPGVTVLDGVGTRGPRETAGQADLPLLPSIRDLLRGDDAPRKIIFSIVEEEMVPALVAATESIVGELQASGNGILVALPVARVVGLRRP
jgi:hypothetical protein